VEQHELKNMRERAEEGFVTPGDVLRLIAHAERIHDQLLCLQRMIARAEQEGTREAY
jgi:hypothetical protein